MKKLLSLIFIPYLLLIGVVFYLYFGPGLISRYEPMQWQGVVTRVPANFHVQIYNSKGWNVYSLGKMGSLIKIAIKDTFDVCALTRFYDDIVFQASLSPDKLFFISKSRKMYEMVYAYRTDAVVLYFSVTTPSIYSCRYIMVKLMEDCFYNGQRILLSQAALPLSVYSSDFLLMGGMLIPLLTLIIIFYLSGKKPGAWRFVGDPIRFEETNVWYTARRKYRRRSSFCYLVLTSTRLMVFLYMRPVYECRFHEQTPDLQFEGKKMIIHTEKDTLVLKPSDIDKWKTCLNEFLMRNRDTEKSSR